MPGFPQQGDDEDDTEPEITEYTYKTYEDYFIDYFNLPSETYTRDETTNVVTVDYSKITKKTINGNTELSYNGNVFNTLTSADLTGKGSETDPYVVRSTKGFLFMFHQKLGMSTWAKYIELDCDVVLNDELFDENGKPSDGDGIVYSWTILSDKTGFYLDGKNHYISGVYFNNEEVSGVSLFYGANTIRNSKFKNVFLKGSSYVGLIRTVYCLYDCVLESGTIISTKVDGYTGGFTHNLYTIAKNCVNYANVSSKYISGGFAGCSSGNFINCINYGNVSGSSHIGGIVGYAYEISIKHCQNYGVIDATTYFSAGIVGNASKTVDVSYCDNYGNITVSEYTGGACAGIIGRTSESLTLYYCNNYGEVSNNSNSGCELVGYFQPNTTTTHYVVLISNCNGCYGLQRFLGSFHVMELPKYDIVLENCYFYNKSLTKEACIVGRIVGEKTNLIIRNMKLVIDCNELYIVSPESKSGSNIEIDNLLIQGKCNSFKFLSIVNYNVGSIIKKTTKKDGTKQYAYYGSSFKGFYFSWKTGNIGLIALDGRGSFQGQIDEEWLSRKGYEKREI